MTSELIDTLVAGNEFGMIWTSFGLGDNEAFNPTLAGHLAKYTTSVDYGLNHLSFTLPVTNTRTDLQLLRYLQKPSAKEVFIETCDQTGVINPTRVRFMITKLESYNASHNTEADKTNVTYAFFSVSGALEVITD